MTESINRPTPSRGMYITLLAISIGVTLIVSFSSYLVYLREKKSNAKGIVG